MKVFSVVKYMKDMNRDWDFVRNGLWQLKCEGKTKEEIIELGFNVHNDWMIEKEKVMIEKLMSVKMYLPDTAEKPREELSREVQEHAFKLGCRWLCGGKQALYIDVPFLFIGYNMGFGEEGDYRYFYKNSYRELTPEQFLAIPIPEPEFDESKVITWANRHEAVIGKDYWYADDLTELKYKGEARILTDINDEEISSPFHVDGCSWAALYPVED